MTRGWIGVDLDGTLAKDVSRAPEVIGPPVTAMVARIKQWLADGVEVRIVTARVAATGEKNIAGTADDDAFARAQRELIEAWCQEHIGQALPVTASKDFMMVALYDDRAVSVVKNTGALLHERMMEGYLEEANYFMETLRQMSAVLMSVTPSCNGTCAGLWERLKVIVEARGTSKSERKSTPVH